MPNYNNDTTVSKELSARERRAFELQQDFTFEGYQVIRRELFSHLRDPAIVIRPNHISFNASCVNGFPEADYINVLINPELKRIVVRKCTETTKDALRWCNPRKGKRYSRNIRCKLFCSKLYETMHWDTRFKYKILGYRILVGYENIYIFDLLETEMFAEDKKKLCAEMLAAGMPDSQVAALIGDRKTNEAYLPSNWRDSFGLPVDKHEEYLKIDSTAGFIPMTDGKAQPAAQG